MRDDPAEEGRRPIKIMNDMPVDLTDFLLRRPSAQTLDQVTVNDIRISVICALSAAATNRPRRYALIWQPVLRFLKIPSTNDNVDRFYKRLPAPISDLEKAGVLAVNRNAKWHTVRLLPGGKETLGRYLYLYEEKVF